MAARNDFPVFMDGVRGVAVEPVAAVTSLGADFSRNEAPATPRVEPVPLEAPPAPRGDDERNLELRSVSAAVSQDSDPSERRVCRHVDSIVHSFNLILQQGLGEVQAKYPIAVLEKVDTHDDRVHGV